MGWNFILYSLSRRCLLVVAVRREKKRRLHAAISSSHFLLRSRFKFQLHWIVKNFRVDTVRSVQSIQGDLRGDTHEIASAPGFHQCGLVLWLLFDWRPRRRTRRHSDLVLLLLGIRSDFGGGCRRVQWNSGVFKCFLLQGLAYLSPVKQSILVVFNKRRIDEEIPTLFGPWFVGLSDWDLR